MRKKNRDDMKKQRVVFEAGCIERGYGEQLAEELFDTIENFADYAFGKSHAYGYGFIAYQTAYLKANYPVEYLSCLLTSVKASYDRAAIFLADARASNITVKLQISILQVSTSCRLWMAKSESSALGSRPFVTWAKPWLVNLLSIDGRMVRSHLSMTS